MDISHRLPLTACGFVRRHKQKSQEGFFRNDVRGLFAGLLRVFTRVFFVKVVGRNLKQGNLACYLLACSSRACPPLIQTKAVVVSDCFPRQKHTKNTGTHSDVVFLPPVFFCFFGNHVITLLPTTTTTFFFSFSSLFLCCCL